MFLSRRLSSTLRVASLRRCSFASRCRISPSLRIRQRESFERYETLDFRELTWRTRSSWLLIVSPERLREKFNQNKNSKAMWLPFYSRPLAFVHAIAAHRWKVEKDRRCISMSSIFSFHSSLLCSFRFYLFSGALQSPRFFSFPLTHSHPHCSDFSCFQSP